MPVAHRHPQLESMAGGSRWIRNRWGEGGERASGWIPISSGRNGKLYGTVSHGCNVPEPARKAAGATAGPPGKRNGVEGGGREVSRSE